ncbi:MAG: ABC transporter permease [Candidatus Dormibacteraeota bacterium]|nr:ABC transporter permease [Candidatus Dormibacteraeota bacterium]
MIRSIAAEFRKVRQRPALLFSALTIVGIVALIYAVSYYQALQPSTGQRGAVSLASLYPAGFVATVIGIVPGLIGAVAVVLGAISVGTEYQWSTIKTQLLQGPGRLTTLFSKFVILAAWMALLTVAFYATAAAGSLSVALLQQHSIAWPAASLIGQAVAATWLIAFCYAMLGAGLAFVFRQSAVALGVGLIYVAVVQTLLVGVLATLGGGAYKWVTKLFDGQNAGSLVDSIAGPGQTPLVGATQATLVLLAYIAMFAAVAGTLARRRDIA